MEKEAMQKEKILKQLSYLSGYKGDSGEDYDRGYHEAAEKFSAFIEDSSGGIEEFLALADSLADPPVFSRKYRRGWDDALGVARLILKGQP